MDTCVTGKEAAELPDAIPLARQTHLPVCAEVYA